MPKRAKKINTAPIAVFATILVVAGIATVAYFSSQKPAVTPQAAKATSEKAKAVEPAERTATSSLLLVNADAVTLLKLDGASERLSKDEFLKRLGSMKVAAEGSKAANGMLAYFNLPANAADKREAFVSPERGYTARLGTPKSDNASVVEVSRGNETPQQIVLRDKKGRPVSEASVLGWFGPRTLALSAVATSSRWVFAADLNGSVRQVAPLPDNAIYSEARGGAVWYASALLGEGIELQPKAPSDLHRVSLDGTDQAVAHDDLRVFLMAVPDGGDHVMYATDDGQAFYLKIGDASSRMALGKRRPLLFMPDGRLVLRDGYDVILYDPATGQVKTLGALPEGEVNVFISF